MKLLKWWIFFTFMNVYQLVISSNIFLISLLVRLHNIEKGNYVVWDESHFGKYSQKYLTRTFYFDVHPPLGKMLTALSGLIFNQDTEFSFESGETYPEMMDYVGMRRFHAFFASFIPVFAELTFRELGYDHRRILFALFFIFENGFIGISRLILLDSHLLFFTSLVIYFLARLFNRPKQENMNLFFLGLSIGCVMSIKWIGFLTMATVGLYIIYELYSLLKGHEFKLLIKKFSIRFLFLLVLPSVLYLGFFILHFAILNNSSIDTTYMSNLFSMTLEGNNSPVHKYVDFGSVITIKTNDNRSGYLHSHSHNYPDSTGQQITTYFHKDLNNSWAFQKVTPKKDIDDYVSDGDELVLFHIQTKKYLGISDEKATYDKFSYRAEGSFDELNESNIFIVEIENDLIEKEDVLKTITTNFRLRAKGTNLYLTYTEEKYPKWGFSQGEVVFSDKRNRSSLWSIADNSFSGDNGNPKYIMKKSIFNIFRFIGELNVQMYKVNGSFEQEEDEKPPLIVSYPYEWFILRRGLRMVGWKNDRYKFYMFGNPFLWYLSGISVLMAPLILLYKIQTLRKRGESLISLRNDFFEVFLFSGGWLIHYLPFFYIGRVLYFHHYYPALFFALLATGYVLKNVNLRIIYMISILGIVGFVAFSPLTYGIRDPSKIKNLKFLTSWDFTD